MLAYINLLKRFFLCTFILPIFAASEKDTLKRFLSCYNAIKSGDIVTLKENFSSELLDRHKVVSTTIPSYRSVPASVNLTYIAASAKHEHAGAMLEYMIEKGLDPNHAETVQWEKRWPKDPADSVGDAGESRYISILLPLDIAVHMGNVPIVKVLLAQGAYAYQTKLLASRAPSLSHFLKTYISDRFGTNLVEYASQLQKDAARGESLPANAAEYQEIVDMLSKAQLAEDIDECMIQ